MHRHHGEEILVGLDGLQWALQVQSQQCSIRKQRQRRGDVDDSGIRRGAGVRIHFSSLYLKSGASRMSVVTKSASFWCAV